MPPDEGITSQPPTHVRGIPNADRLKFLPGHILEYGTYDWSASAEAVAARLGRPVARVDEGGFDDEIVAGAIDEAGGRVAWLQCRSKQSDGGFVDVSFRLHATVYGKPFVAWEPKSYNPFFGINPLALGWEGESLGFIYSEKHHVYRAVFDAAGRLTLGLLSQGRFVPPDEAERESRQRIFAHRARQKEKRGKHVWRLAEVLRVQEGGAAGGAAGTGVPHSGQRPDAGLPRRS
jgi:hypothetical protein